MPTPRLPAALAALALLGGSSTFSLTVAAGEKALLMVFIEALSPDAEDDGRC